MKEKTVEEMDKERGFENLKKDCLSCRKCAIGGKTIDGKEWKPEPDDDGVLPCITNVFSNMNLDADVMVVGQNPGADEVGLGEPFVGASGKVFDAAMKDVVGLDRSNLYITNVVKCYTQGNRKPTQSELDNCRDFLDLEIELLNPKVIVALGSFAFKQLTGMSGIMKHCGTVVPSPRYLTPVLALLHPSPFNTNNPERREMFMKGLEKLREVLQDG